MAAKIALLSLFACLCLSSAFAGAEVFQVTGNPDGPSDAYSMIGDSTILVMDLSRFVGNESFTSSSPAVRAFLLNWREWEGAPSLQPDDLLCYVPCSVGCPVRSVFFPYGTGSESYTIRDSGVIERDGIAYGVVVTPATSGQVVASDSVEYIEFGRSCGDAEVAWAVKSFPKSIRVNVACRLSPSAMETIVTALSLEFVNFDPPSEIGGLPMVCTDSESRKTPFEYRLMPFDGCAMEKADLKDYYRLLTKAHSLRYLDLWRLDAQGLDGDYLDNFPKLRGLALHTCKLDPMKLREAVLRMNDLVSFVADGFCSLGRKFAFLPASRLRSVSSLPVLDLTGFPRLQAVVDTVYPVSLTLRNPHLPSLEYLDCGKLICDSDSTALPILRHLEVGRLGSDIGVHADLPKLTLLRIGSLSPWPGLAGFLAATRVEDLSVGCLGQTVADSVDFTVPVSLPHLRRIAVRSAFPNIDASAVKFAQWLSGGREMVEVDLSFCCAEPDRDCIDSLAMLKTKTLYLYGWSGIPEFLRESQNIRDARFETQEQWEYLEWLFRMDRHDHRLPGIQHYLRCIREVKGTPPAKGLGMMSPGKVPKERE